MMLQLGTSAMDNTLLKYSAKDHFFKAVLCHLCVDFLNGQLAMNKYKDMQPAFADSRECKFLEVSLACALLRLARCQWGCVEVPLNGSIST